MTAIEYEKFIEYIDYNDLMNKINELKTEPASIYRKRIINRYRFDFSTHEHFISTEKYIIKMKGESIPSVNSRFLQLFGSTDLKEIKNKIKEARKLLKEVVFGLK